jgi:hypothetical protein
MRKLYTILFVFLFYCQVSGQTISVDPESKVYGNIGTEMSFAISIKNLTDKPITLHIQRIELQIGSGQSSYFCWENDCLGENEDNFRDTITLEPGLESLNLRSVLETGLVEYTSNVKYLIYDVNHPEDSVVHEVVYTINAPNSKGFLFHNRDIKISNLYPNPVNNYANFDYNLSNRNDKAKIILHNVLGGIVGEYDLPFFENKLNIPTSDLNPGVYFYTLQLDSKNLITKKMIIRRS